MKDRYDFFLSGPIGNVANYKERFAEAERILHDVFGWYVRNLKPEPLFENKETGVLWSVQF